MIRFTLSFTLIFAIALGFVAYEPVSAQEPSTEDVVIARAY
jgi:hypothetical protein